MNLIELAANIYLRHLVASCPQALAVTPHRQLKPQAATFELGLNHLIREILLQATLEEVALNALFGMGVIHTGLGIYGDVEIEGVTHDVGQPFADVVDDEDWVFDVQARRYEAVRFAGHRYRLPLDYVKDSDLFTNTENLKATHLSSPPDRGEERTSEISRGANPQMDQGEYLPEVELWNIWLPLENLVLSLTLDSEDGPPIREVDWEGPEQGMYRLLGFSKVPGQLMCLPPRALWTDIHELTNRLFRKLTNQAERQKSNLVYGANAAGDAERIVKAADGEAIQVNNPQAVKEVRWGGVDPANLAFVIQAIQQFSWFAGNLDALGGLSPQTETVGQERLLAAGASKRIQYMQDKTVNFATDVIRDLGWYLWYTQNIELPLVKRSGGVDIPVHFTPDQREGDFLDYNLTIEPYSMQRQSPAEKLQAIVNTVQTFIMPALPLLQAHGVMLDMRALLRIIGKYGNLPELEDILITGQPILEPGGPVNPAPARPTNTTRRYVRVNQPAGTRQGRDAAMMQTLLGAGAQDADMAGLMRMNSGRSQ
jgi:hypothetical protein